MKKLLLIAALLIAGVVSANAQQLNYRVEAGLNVANMTVKSGNESLNTKPILGYRVGGAVEIGFNDNFYLAPGLTFRMNGAKYSVLKEYITISSHMVSIPLNAGFRQSFGNDLFISLEAGPYAAFGMKGKVSAGSMSVDLYKDNKYIDDLRRFDIGMGASAALHYTNFFLRVGTEFGLLNQIKNSGDNGTVRHTDFFTTIGYRF